MKFETLEQLQAFVLWAQDHGAKRLKVGDIELEFNEVHMLSKLQESKPEMFKDITDFEGKTLTDTEKLTQNEMDELLYWSTNK